VIFDLDGTLLSSEGREHGAKELLEALHRNGITLAIASRNDFYVAIEKLETVGVKQYFAHIAADFRPKGYQVRDMLRIFAIQNRHFDEVLFVDDTQSNIESVSRALPSVKCIHVGKRGQELRELEKIVMRYLQDSNVT